jgi:hypothetical protein
MTDTINQRVLKHLQNGHMITPLQALRLFGTIRLAAAIYDLRKEGNDIKMEPMTVGRKRFASYWMGLLAFGYLVGSSIQYIYPPGQPPQQIIICRYSDGAVLTFPGLVCPSAD